jgi:hypothetical protein
MFEGKATVWKGLAESEGGAGNFSGDTEGVGEAADPFGFSCTEWAVESEDRTWRQEGEMASGVGAGGGSVRTDLVGRKFSGGDHSRGGGVFRCESLGEDEGRCRWG